MKTIFHCELKTKDRNESWTGKITKLVNYGSHYEIRIESRTGITVLIGICEQGNFDSIPDWNAGCYLSSLKDSFWNKERLCDALGLVDGITVTSALYSLADYIKL
jgi:hypothetical protein